MTDPPPLGDPAREARLRIAQRLAELHRVHIALAQESRNLKQLTIAGRAGQEIEIAAEMMEQYLGASGAFLENMRGRFEARLGLLRRGDPDDAQGHGNYWLSFSRLCAALRRAERRGGS